MRSGFVLGLMGKSKALAELVKIKRTQTAVCHQQKLKDLAKNKEQLQLERKKHQAERNNLQQIQKQQKLQDVVKISESTEFKIDLKTVVSIIIITSMFMTMYFTLQSDIEEAKKMPEAVIDRIEYDLKQQWQTKHIEDLEEKMEDLLFWCKQMDEKIEKKKDK